MELCCEVAGVTILMSAAGGIFRAPFPCKGVKSRGNASLVM